MLVLRFFSAWFGIVFGLTGLVALIGAIYLHADITFGAMFTLIGGMLIYASRPSR